MTTLTVWAPRAALVLLATGSAVAACSSSVGGAPVDARRDAVAFEDVPRDVGIDRVAVAMDAPASDAPPDVPGEAPTDVPVDVAADARSDARVDPPPPSFRLIAPLSGSVVTTARPVLRWRTAGPQRSHVEVCADRACARVLETIDTTDTTATPTARLAPGPAWWRVTAPWGLGADPVTSPVWELFAPRLDAPHAGVVGGVLDVDADGYADVVATGYAYGSVDTVTVLAGGPTPESWRFERSTVLAPTPMFGIGPQALASAGDVDGDGLGDIVVSWPGQVFVVLGGAGSATADRIRELDVPDPLHAGSDLEVAGVGDLDADGYGEVAVGAYAYGPHGRVLVHHGGPSGPSAAAWLVVDGAPDEDHFGLTLAGVGDVGGDGSALVAVGAPRAAAGAGVVSLFDAAGVRRVLDTGTPSIRLISHVVGLGDVTGDGLADIAVAAQASSPTTGTTDLVRIYPGAPPGTRAAPIDLFSPVAGLWGFGMAVRGVGDADGDGISDVAIGAPGASRHGVVYVYRGGSPFATAPAATLDGLSLSPAPMGDFGGVALAGGDLDRDGFADIVAGAPNGGADVGGEVSVYRGGASGPAMAPARMFTGGLEEGFGRHLAGAW